MMFNVNIDTEEYANLERKGFSIVETGKDEITIYNKVKEIVIRIHYNSNKNVIEITNPKNNESYCFDRIEILGRSMGKSLYIQGVSIEKPYLTQCIPFLV